MVIFWVVSGATTLLIFIIGIDKRHHKITIKEQQAITRIIKIETQEQVKRVESKTNEILESEQVK